MAEKRAIVLKTIFATGIGFLIGLYTALIKSLQGTDILFHAALTASECLLAMLVTWPVVKFAHSTSAKLWRVLIWGAWIVAGGLEVSLMIRLEIMTGLKVFDTTPVAWAFALVLCQLLLIGEPIFGSKKEADSTQTL